MNMKMNYVMINGEILIKEVKKLRILYDTNNKDFYNRNKKKQAWQDVYSVLHPDWETIDDNGKVFFGKEVQKKWVSIRDLFRRELVLQTTLQPKNSKRGKYRHFDELQFLIPFTSIKTGKTEKYVKNGSKDGSDTSKGLEDNRKVKRKRKRPIKNSDDEDIIPIKERYTDDDEAFLRSLMPEFKEYTLHQKIMLRIELMNTILKFKESQNMVTMTCEVNKYEDHGVTVKLER